MKRDFSCANGISAMLFKIKTKENTSAWNISSKNCEHLKNTRTANKHHCQRTVLKTIHDFVLHFYITLNGQKVSNSYLETYKFWRWEMVKIFVEKIRIYRHSFQIILEELTWTKVKNDNNDNNEPDKNLFKELKIIRKVVYLKFLSRKLRYN